MPIYQVVEIFESINGEGLRQGELAVFVRMKGCNLDCSYCDTRWANVAEAAARPMTGEEILAQIRQSGIANVTLTGGEPLLQPEIDSLLALLAQEKDLRVEIETNGSVNLAPFLERENRPSFTMDYKLPGSGMEAAMCHANLDLLTGQDTIKFVVGDRQDLERARALILTHGLTQRCHVFFSPVFGKIVLEEIVDFLKEHRLNQVRMQLQIHKIIWDSEMRGV